MELGGNGPRQEEMVDGLGLGVVMSTPTDVWRRMERCAE